MADEDLASNKKPSRNLTSFLDNITNVAAPMVAISELPWRMMLREKYNVHLCYTPMINSKDFVRCKDISKIFTTCNNDRPLVVQFNGNDANVILEAAKKVEKMCDAIDLNLGCPQNIAKRGKYGAFLADDWDRISLIIKTLKSNLSIAVSVKIRIFDSMEKTLKYVTMIQESGADFIAVHGRTRDQKGLGFADWHQIAAIRKLLKIPVISNGNIQVFDDVLRCMNETGVRHIMSADGLLYNPALFTNVDVNVFEVANNLIDYYQKYQFTAIKALKAAIFKLIHNFLTVYPPIAQIVYKSGTTDDIRNVVKFIENKVNFFISSQQSIPLSLYTQHNHLIWMCQTRYRSNGKDQKLLQDKDDIIDALCLKV